MKKLEQIVEMIENNKEKTLFDLELNNLDLSGLDFSNFSFRDKKITNCNFDNCNLTLADFEGAVIKNCSFKNITILDDVNVSYAKFYNCNIKDFYLSHIHFINVLFEDCKMKDCDLSHSIFSTSSFDNCEIDDCDFSNTEFFQTILLSSDFKNCNFKGSDLHETSQTTVDFIKSNLNVKKNKTKNINAIINKGNYEFLKIIHREALKHGISKIDVLIKFCELAQNLNNHPYLKDAFLEFDDLLTLKTNKNKNIDHLDALKEYILINA